MPNPGREPEDGRGGAELSSRQMNIMRRQARAQKRKAQELADLSAKSDSLNANSSSSTSNKKLKADDLYSPPPLEEVAPSMCNDFYQTVLIKEK